MNVDLVVWAPIVVGVLYFAVAQWALLGMNAMGARGYEFSTTVAAACGGLIAWFVVMLIVRGIASLL